jgi:outer membrane receptor protein involved in Fe transport
VVTGSAVRRAVARSIMWAAAAGAHTAAAGASAAPSVSIEEITVTAQRLELLGSATTASEGVVADDELQLAPSYRPGQLLETVPGLIATLHSGEGKANQYLLRGYNLDHGTDLATFVDGMPVNQPTHAHGQGYTDLNFLIPEIADAISFTKGPYYADVGDFGAVGSVRIGYRSTVPDEISACVGTLGYQRLFAAGSAAAGPGQLLAAAELQHYDGPFVTPDDARKENAVVRYSGGDERNGYSAALMYYHQLWTSTTDIPLRAIAEGLVPDRFGSLDPTDGGRAQRASLSVNYHSLWGPGRFMATGFFIHNELNLFNDFTHFLVNPVEGDQEDQFENRNVTGASAAYAMPFALGSTRNELSVGAVMRYDGASVGRDPSVDQVPVTSGAAPASYFDADRIYLLAAGTYVEAITRWTSRMRTVLAIRDDFQRGTDVDDLAALHERAGYTNGGTAAQSLVQPKGSLIYTASDALEFYASAGRGFHSADLRGVNQDESVDLGLPHTPLLARQEGQEVGLRAAPRSNLALTAALYNLWQQSETVIDPDVGQDVAGPPSRRYGYEINVTYQINRVLELYASYSGDHTRFTRPFDDGTGHLGTYITDAPVGTGSLSLYARDLGPWSGGLSYRYLGNYPLSSGPCVNAAAVHDFPGVASSCATAPTVSGQVNGKGFGELNLDVHRSLTGGWSASLGIYNLLNTHAAAAQFWYVDRLRNEIAAYPDGRADLHEHPLEPFMVRLTVTKRLGP